MYKRGEVMIRGTLPNGTEGPMDPLDLSEDSWRAFSLEMMRSVGARYGMRHDHPGAEVRYTHKNYRGGERERVDTGLPSTSAPNRQPVADAIVEPDMVPETRNVGIAEGTGPGATTPDGTAPPPASTERPTDPAQPLATAPAAPAINTTTPKPPAAPAPPAAAPPAKNAKRTITR